MELIAYDCQSGTWATMGHWHAAVSRYTFITIFPNPNTGLWLTRAPISIMTPPRCVNTRKTVAQLQKRVSNVLKEPPCPHPRLSIHHNFGVQLILCRILHNSRILYHFHPDIPVSSYHRACLHRSAAVCQDPLVSFSATAILVCAWDLWVEWAG